MKEQVIKTKEFLFYLLAFAMPCFIYSAPAVILLYAIAWIIQGNLKERLSVAFRNKFVWLFCAYYLLDVIGLLYTSNMTEGSFDLEVKLSLFIFPIMLASEGQMPFTKQRRFIYLFIAGLICNGLICVGYALWRLLALHDLVFQYKEFSLFMHPSYYSMYIDFALVAIFFLLTKKELLISRGKRIYLYVAIFFLEFMLVLLQSKTGMIVSLLVLGILIVRYLVLTKKWINTVAILGGLVGVYLLTYDFIITAGRSRIISATETLTTSKPSKSATESSQVRIFVWKSAWNVIKENPIVGVGTGDVSNVLLAQYAKDGAEGALKEKLNAHDQYMQTTIALGAIGLLVLLAMFLIPLYISIQEKRFVYMMFLGILLINFLTESMFQTQGGTMFYGLFNSLLMFNFVI
jgi:O-antigen ligase